MKGQDTSYSSENDCQDFDQAALEELLVASIEGLTPSLNTVWERLSSEQRSEAVKLIGMRHSLALKGLVLTSLSSRNARERANAVEVLGKLDAEQSVVYIEPCLEDPDNRVRANAVLLLWDSSPELAKEALYEMLRSDNMWMRSSAAYVLTRECNEMFRTDLERLLDDEQDTVREKVIAALGNLGPGPSEKPLLLILSNEMTHPFIKVEIIKALSKMGRGKHSESSSLILQIAKNEEENDFVRLEAVKVLGHIGESGAVPLLSDIAACQNVDEYLRVAALESLGSLGGAQDLLLGLLADPMEKDIIRERTSITLGRMGVSDLVPKLRNLLNEENEDLLLSLIARIEEHS